MDTVRLLCPLNCMENAMTFKSFLSTSAVLVLTLSIGCAGDRKDGFGVYTGTDGDSDSEDTDIFDTDDTDTDDTDADIYTQLHIL